MKSIFYFEKWERWKDGSIIFLRLRSFIVKNIKEEKTHSQEMMADFLEGA